VAASVAGALAEVAAPAVLAHAVDLAVAAGRDAGGGAPAAGLTAWLAVGAALVAVSVAADALRELAGGRSSALVTSTLRRRLLRRAFDAGPALTERHSPGELCGRVVGNAAESGRQPVATGTLVAAAVPTAGSAVALALLDPWLLVTFAVGTGVVGPVVQRFFRASGRVATRYLAAQADLATRLVDALAGARTIAAAGTVDREIERVLVPLPDLRAEGRAAWRTLARGSAQGAALGPLVQLAVIGVAGVLLARGRLGPGAVLAAGWYASLGTGLDDVVGQVSRLARARAATARVGEILAWPVPGHGRADLPPGPGTLELRGVTVGAGGQPVLDGVDLIVPGGQAVALVGRPAATSALAAAVGHLRPPDRGQVVLDGVPLARLGRPALRRAVTTAFDRPALLGDTVADAVAFGIDTPTPAAVAVAIESACADRFVARLPAGAGTPLAEAPMSGGELQRLGLARAMAHAGRLVVLDDATSSLDTATELQIGEALTRVLAGRTVLVVAHRASTASRTDLVAWLDGGRVRALAPHAVLWDDPDYRAVFAAGRPAAPAGVP
jgi:ATP-binding cassette subfamily B protein